MRRRSERREGRGVPRRAALGLGLAAAFALRGRGASGAELSTGALAVHDGLAGTAEAWLTLLDLGRYGDALGSTGEIMRNSVTPDVWSAKLRAVREPLGPVRSRTLMTDEAKTELPGAPDGDWRILRFATSFANKAAAVETVVLRREPGGYRVDGYFIR